MSRKGLFIIFKAPFPCLFILSCILCNIQEGLLAEIDFNRDIRPILSQNCISCHGLDQPKSNLRLDFAEFAYIGGKSGIPAIVPGHPEESELLVRVRKHGEGHMPKKGDSLNAGQISLLEKWIKSGGSYATHWAYVLPERSDSKGFTNHPFIQNPIDSFVIKALKERDWKPSPSLSNEKWLRRVSLGLIGLPPTLTEIEDFISDTSSRSREKVVDRLLASPRYGEHWARQWLDLARYADSNGFQADQLRDSWAFRDWVIEAMNSDMPFNQFTIEQIAGDLLPKPTLSQKIATGFHRTPTCNVEAGVHPEENRVNQVFDRVNTTGLTWLGTTLECAQCHSHKYDPISQEEYYQIFSFFNNTPLEVENKSGNGVSFNFWGPKMELPLSSEKKKEMDRITALLKEKKDRLKILQVETDAEFPNWVNRLKEETVKTKDSEPEWTILEPKEASSDQGESFQILKDNSLLVKGKPGDRSTYSVHLHAKSGRWNSLRLETLLHPSMKQKGPGRNFINANPNFVLTELSLFHADSNKSITISKAQADFYQSTFKPEQLFDGKFDSNNGWAISPEFGESHWVKLEFLKPLILEEDTLLLIEMKHLYGGGRNVGRPRFSLSKNKLLLSPAINKKLIGLLSKIKRTSKEEKEFKKIFEAELPQLVSLRKEVNNLEKVHRKLVPPTTLVMVEMNQTRETHVMSRGDYLSPKKKVQPGVPEAFHAWKDKWPSNRLGFAKWLVDPKNPLTARVTVNRWWGQLFGTGIVSTEADFGSQGELPTHSELLDWLSVEFMESGWSMKHIHRLIALSSTYGQSSRVTNEILELDPTNRYFMRGPRLRMSAEMIRDNALRVSGLLSEKMGGAPIYPPQPDGLWRQTGRNEPKYIAARNEDRFRRGIYIIWRRAAPYASFVNFDGPDRSSCLPKRSRTNTPLQALTLLNDQAYVEMAMSLACTILEAGNQLSDKEKITMAFRRTLTRYPNDREIEILRDLRISELKRLRKEPKRVDDLISSCSVLEIPDGLSMVELASWFFVANALLNLDETITKG